MRLLHVDELSLREFIGDKIPVYAILSHTWGDDEVSFQDMQSARAKKRKSYPKLLGTCKRAKRDGYEWVWVDTCCIDKSSSAELQESINSMFQWYRSANICYAYLADVPDRRSGWTTIFNESRWWQRGWTLRKFCRLWCRSNSDT